MAYLLTVSALFILTVFLGFWLQKSIRKTVYSFKNVNICALIICVILFMMTVVTDSIVFSFQDGSAHIISCLKNFPEYFAHFAIWGFIVLGILMFFSNIFLIRHEGMKPVNMVGTFLGVIVVGGTVIAFLISLVFENAEVFRRYSVLSKILPIYFYLLVDYCDCIILGIIIMGYVASKQKPKYDKDFIIVLGCSISKNGGLRPLLKGRTNRAIRYAWEQEIACGKKVYFVPSGGKGSDEVISEGSAMELYLLSHGAETDEVFPEKQSVNTFENFAFSRKIIEEMKKDAKIAFATTNYHMFRSGLLAQKNGIDAEGIASSTKWYFWPNGFAREVVAIFNMTKKQHIISAIALLVLDLIIAFAF